MKDIVLFWVQWSGKWTQAKKILNHFGDKISYFEAGNILRALKSKPNCLWEYVKNKIDNWELVSDDFISSMYRAFLSVISEENKIALVDGYPRKNLQMNHFLDSMNQAKRDYDVIYLELSKEKAIERLSSRRICNECGEVYSKLVDHIDSCKNCGSTNIVQREDDYPEAIETRLKLYYQETQPVIDYMESLGKLIKIDADQSPESVFESIIACLDKSSQ